MDHIEAAKLALRDQLVTARGRLPLAEIGARAHAIATLLLAAPEVRRAATVAAYVSVGREPGTGPLLDALVAAGKRVVLPLLQADDDLDWAAYAGADGLVAAGRGLLEPRGPALGPEAIATADAVIVPGLAVDRTGLRLGAAAGPTTGPWDASRSAPSPASCSTTRRSSRPCPPPTTTARSPPR